MVIRGETDETIFIQPNKRNEGNTSLSHFQTSSQKSERKSRTFVSLELFVDN